MIGGDPGVGKTRLCGELAAEAQERGFLTVVGCCYDMEGGVPYQPFVEALEQIVRVVPAADLRGWLGEDAPEVARLAPGLRRLFPDVPAAAEVPPEEGRRLLLRAWNGFFERAAQTRPILLVLDDVHWADESSLLLLQHLARQLAELPVLVLCTYRDVELGLTRPLAKTLQELVRQRLARDVLLRALPEQGVAEMIEAHGPAGMPPPALVGLVYGETEGNPFFVEEVLRHLDEEHKLLNPDGTWASGVSIGEMEVPRSIRLVVEQRLGRLSNGCRRMLTNAAVVGRDFPFEVVAALGDLESEALIEAVEEAERAALLHDTSRGPEVRFSFSHELVRQTLIGGLTLPRRQRVHHRVAEATEAVYASNLDAHLTELAFHYRQAGAVANPEKSIDYSVRAGDAAAAVFAWQEAASHFEGALDSLEGAKAPDLHRRCQVLLALGEVLVSTRNAQRVYEALAPEAHELAVKLGATEEAARAAGQVVRSLRVQFGVLALERPDYQKWAERLDRLAAPMTVQRIEADLAMAHLTGSQLREEEAEERCLHALSLVQQLSAPRRLELSAFHTFALNCQGPRFDSQRRRLASDMSESLVTLPRAVSLLAAESAMVQIASEALRWGDRSEASRVVDLMAHFEAQRPAENGPGLAVQFREVLFRYMDGDLEAATTTASRVMSDVVSGALPATFAGYAQPYGARARHLLGGWAAALQSPLESDDRAPSPLRRLMLAAMGRREEVRAALLQRREAAPEGSSGAPDSWPIGELTICLEAATLIADLELTSWFAAPLWGSGAATTGTRYTTMVKRHLGAAATLLGEPERARSYFERALVEAVTMRFRPEVALTRFGLADLLLRHSSGELQEAMKHLDFAIAEFREMKMQPALESALALLETAKAQVVKHPALPGGLSEREAEVLRLVARGRTNAEIAEALVISPHTVANHVSRVFEKLGTAHRADAAAWAVRNGLAE